MNSHSPLQTIDQLDPKQFIIVEEASVNNLKKLSLAIPRYKLVAVTGLSGSGKTSLTLGTIFAEGQRRYIESLNSYVQQFLGKLEKPAVKSIKGLSPAIAIEQKTHHANPRSTVGTITEIYDYLKLLYARIGVTYSPVSGEKVTKQTIEDVIQYIHRFPAGTRVVIGYPWNVSKNNWGKQLPIELAKGFTRLIQGDIIHTIEDVMAHPAALSTKGNPIYIIVDRLIVGTTDLDDLFRLTDSIRTAFFEGNSTCYVKIIDKEEKVFSDQFERDGIQFEEPSINLFSFNNSYGACKKCDGLGKITGLSPAKIIPNRLLSVYEGAIHPWKFPNMAKWLQPLLEHKAYKNFPLHRPYKDLSADEKKLLWDGDKNFKGIHAFFEHMQTEEKTLSTTIFLSHYRDITLCPSCQGTRLRHDATYVKVANHSITDLVQLPIYKLIPFFSNLQLPPTERKIAERPLLEIISRLQYMGDVGLGYLTLVREANTLSGGEYQRIKLATALGNTLVETLYILDEPTIGLHPRDTQKLVDILVALKNKGNSVIVVDHEEAIMRAADHLIDIGPEAGAKGGELVFQGNWEELRRFNGSYTARYLNGVDKIPLPAARRTPRYYIEFKGITENNLQDINCSIPLEVFTVITGVSGSGKSTLVKKIIYPAIANQVGIRVNEIGKFDSLSGDYGLVQHVELVDQNPIGRSSRSNPVTYIKAYDFIRQIFANQPIAKSRQYTPGHFSFNTAGGRCETCQGEGKVTINMQFMADITLTCEDCNGNRFKSDVLEVTYQGKSIIDVLNLTVDEALAFFYNEAPIYKRLQALQTAGMGYVTLGQSVSLLSGGEAQRLKLATYLLEKGDDHTLFILDEPTKGLHVHDIRKLVTTFQRLIAAGHTILVIEHTMDLIQCADWIIDLGPEGGDQGGQIVCSGPPEQIINCPHSHTARYLHQKLAASTTTSHG